MTHLIAVGGSKLVADLGSGQGGSGRLPLRTCSSNRTGEIPPSGMIVERGGDVIRLLDGTLTARLLATRQAIRAKGLWEQASVGEGEGAGADYALELSPRSGPTL